MEEALIPVTTGKKTSAEGAEKKRSKTNELTRQIIGAAMKVHAVLGPGLLESAYEACLKHELVRRGFRVETQIAIPVIYEGLQVDLGYGIDMLVEDEVVLELKAVERVLPVHRAQLTSYLRLSGKKVGLLFNFHTVRLKDGITRVVNNF